MASGKRDPRRLPRRSPAVRRTPLEATIVAALAQTIERDQLWADIEGTAHVERLVESLRQEHVIPAFSLDYLTRRACIVAAGGVLQHLRGLKIISVNKSISATPGEVLRPDIVAFNQNTRAIVAFEVKRDRSTEREAVAELLAYEHEIRNHFPFAGNLDICFVVVATHWDPLLDHGVASAVTWSGKRCLCLAPTPDHRWKVRIPDPWQLLNKPGIPEHALQAIDLLLEPKTEHVGRLSRSTPGELPLDVQTALDVIARSGDRSGCHGFGMAWRARLTGGEFRWGITVCALDPAALFVGGDEPGRGGRLSTLARFFKDKGSDSLPPTFPPNCDEMMADGQHILTENWVVQRSRPCSWHTKIVQDMWKTSPVWFEFWGEPGAYIRSLVSRSAGRDLLPGVQAGLDWRAPSVALPVLQYLCGRETFKRGTIRCSGAFKAGVILGSLRMLLENVVRLPESEERRSLEASIEWTALDAWGLLVEMLQVYRASEGLRTPPPSLKGPFSEPVAQLTALTALHDWVVDELFGSPYAEHQLCFGVGYEGGPIFHRGLQAIVPEESLRHALPVAGPFAQEVLVATLVAFGTRTSEGSVVSQEQAASLQRLSDRLFRGQPLESLDAEEAVRRLVRTVSAGEIVAAFEQDVLVAADAILPVASRRLAPVAPMDLDLDWMKRCVRAAFSEGERYPAIIIEANGEVGIGSVPGDSPVRTAMLPIGDPDTEVFVWVDVGVSIQVVRTTWEQIERDGLSGMTGDETDGG